MICNCILAGTSACKNCPNNYEYEEYKLNIRVVNTFVPETNDYLKIISELSKHIDTLREENKELRNELNAQKD